MSTKGVILYVVLIGKKYCILLITQCSSNSCYDDLWREIGSGVDGPDGRLARADGQLRVEHPGVARLAPGDVGPRHALSLNAARLARSWMYHPGATGSEDLDRGCSTAPCRRRLA